MIDALTNPDVDVTAREHAKRQWATNPCGNVDAAPSGTPSYFDEVMRARYQQQSWMHRYFGFEQFAGRRVLEIGIGHGTDLLQFAEGGATCAAVDITRKHLELGRHHFETRGRRVLLLESDATAIATADASFDCVYSFGVLHHIPEIERCVAEAHRVLKPGGTLYLALYYKWSAFHLFTKLLCHGIRQGQLFRLGYRGLLATVEQGADGIAIKPYVRTYSKRGVRRLLRRFAVQDVSVHQLAANDFYPAVLARVLKRSIPALDGRLGWYVTAIARKPDNSPTGA